MKKCSIFALYYVGKRESRWKKCNGTKKNIQSRNIIPNRELSWVKFNERVLSEARDKSLPLFERLKFLSITASNLDEFFMIRVASLKDMVHAKYTKTDIAGMTAKEQVKSAFKSNKDW